MKELLYSATVFLLLYILYVDKSLVNLVIVSVSLIILAIYVMGFKQHKTEHFVTKGKSVESKMYNDESFKEVMDDDIKEGLVYYITSFSKELIDFDNSTLLDGVTNQMGAVLQQNLTGAMKYDSYSQYEGVRITKKVECPSPKTLLETFDTFSMFWYMRIVTPAEYFTNDSMRTFSLIEFDHGNVSNNTFTLFQIRFTFGKDMYNPTIGIYIADSLIASYTYSSSDYFKKKIFADDKHHLFTFVKDSGKVFFYIDNYPIIECSDENCFNVNDVSIHEDDTEIILRDTFTRMNPLFRNNSSTMEFYLNTFGVYRRRALDMEDINRLYKHYTDIKMQLDPTMVSTNKHNSRLNKELNRFKRECPFSNEAICNSAECFNFKNWNDIDALVKNKDCFAKVVHYCDGLSNLENDHICTFLKKDNIFKMASSLDPNLFMYNPQNTTNLDETVNTDVLHKLDQLGLKNIYLDKSYRDTNGKYSGEIQRLINDLTKTNQTVDIDTLDALHSSQADTNVTTDIDYNNLFNNAAFSNDMSYNNMYNELLSMEDNKAPSLPYVETTELAKPATNQVPMDTDLIDLSYDDIQKPDVYNHILKKHKEDKIESEIGTWNFANVLNGWF
ncbi:hypothetical protein QKU58_gp118 [Pyramimonas orientalis virus]|uniref:Uncharacterized protein n=1 Tax=Pyramimonas orientalis virus 01B TaxID=3134525 RepID=A0A7M3UNG0_9VIRU|nr:hypothetical protein QKU58_gp118 [Pyramimonas orientalis virus]QOI90213.1 hypothetical protein HWQ62_00076 [Pyramimonas orientalis virus]